MKYIRKHWMQHGKYVSFVDYPKYGYRNWSSQIQRVLQRLSIKADKETLNDLTRLYENANGHVFQTWKMLSKKQRSWG
jgi:hypothetical protein